MKISIILIQLTMEVTELVRVAKDLGEYNQPVHPQYLRKAEINPLNVSIITVTFNSSSTVKDALESVRNQTYTNIEHIVIDGCSSDNTLEIVRSYPHVNKCLCEKDKGIYEAMNKGLQMATGDIIGILNSDDFYADNEIIAKVVNVFEKTNTETVYGDLLYVHAKHVDHITRKWISGKYTRMSFKLGWMPPHPTFFVKKEVYDKVGSFNSSFRCAADYEMMLRILYKFKFNSLYLPEVLVKMRSGGMSNGSIKKRLLANSEDRLAWKLNGLRPFFFTRYLKPLRKVLQFITKEKIKRLFFLNNY